MIMSSIDFEEAGHKLMKLRLQRGMEPEVATMLLECCTQERTYIKYYGLLAQRFCQVDRSYQTAFEDIFFQQYQLIHRLETGKLRNCARLFGHLMASDAVSWEVLRPIRITEADTTSSSRIFLKILFQDLAETLGLRRLNERLQDPELQHAYVGIFPRDTAKNTRFGINFFTSIGLGGVTDELREFLKNMPKAAVQQAPTDSDSDSEMSDTTTTTTSSGGSSSSSDLSDSSDSSDSSDTSDSDTGGSSGGRRRRDAKRRRTRRSRSRSRSRERRSPSPRRREGGEAAREGP